MTTNTITLKEGGDINLVALRGNLGADPEVRTSAGGFMFVNLRVATTEKWKDRATQEWKQKVEWHRVSVGFNDVAVNTAEGLHKGDRVYVEGKITTRKWTDQSGVEKYSTEIEVGRFGKIERIASDESAPSRAARAAAPAATKPAGWDDDLNDALPF